jgi:hypothetical protein
VKHHYKITASKPPEHQPGVWYVIEGEFRPLVTSWISLSTVWQLTQERPLVVLPSKEAMVQTAITRQLDSKLQMM